MRGTTSCPALPGQASGRTASFSSLWPQASIFPSTELISQVPTARKGTSVKIRLVVTGRGYHAAESLPDPWEVPSHATVDDVLGLLVERYGDRPGWSPTCLIAVAGRHLGTVASHEPAVLREGDEVTLIAPVAGG